MFTYPTKKKQSYAINNVYINTITLYHFYYPFFVGLTNSTLTTAINNSTETWNLTALSVLHLSFNLFETDYIVLTARVPILVWCLYVNSSEGCNKDILMLLRDTDGNLTSSYLTPTGQYQWIDVWKQSFLTVTCPCQANISLQRRSSGVTIHASLITLSINNMSDLFVYRFGNVSKGIYKLLADTRLTSCNYLSQDSDRNWSGVFPYSLQTHMTTTSQTPPRSTGTYITELDNITVTHDQFMDNTTNELETTQPYIKQSATSQNDKPVVSTDRSLIEILSMQQSSSKPTSYATKPNSWEEELPVNDRFSMVVDIVQANDDTRQLMSNNLQERNKNEPTYIVNVDSSANVEEDDSGKSLFAVILSLIGALLAVAVFILGFVLNDYLSRRNRCRNTRIRPFVSYY